MLRIGRFLMRTSSTVWAWRVAAGTRYSLVRKTRPLASSPSSTSGRQRRASVMPPHLTAMISRLRLRMPSVTISATSIEIGVM